MNTCHVGPSDVIDNGVTACKINSITFRTKPSHIAANNSCYCDYGYQASGNWNQELFEILSL